MLTSAFILSTSCLLTLSSLVSSKTFNLNPYIYTCLYVDPAVCCDMAKQARAHWFSTLDVIDMFNSFRKSYQIHWFSYGLNEFLSNSLDCHEIMSNSIGFILFSEIMTNSTYFMTFHWIHVKFSRCHYISFVFFEIHKISWLFIEIMSNSSDFKTFHWNPFKFHRFHRFSLKSCQIHWFPLISWKIIDFTSKLVPRPELPGVARSCPELPGVCPEFAWSLRPNWVYIVVLSVKN